MAGPLSPTPLPRKTIYAAAWIATKVLAALASDRCGAVAAPRVHGDRTASAAGRPTAGGELSTVTAPAP